jgi:hypothetical protein
MSGIPDASDGAGPSAEQQVKDPLWDVLRLIITVVAILFGAWAYTVAGDFRPRAAYFPVAAAGIIVVFGTLQLIQDVRNYLSGRPVVIPGLDVESPIFGLGARGLLPALRYIAWFAGYAGAMYVTGVLVSSFVFVTVFLLTEARWRLGGALAVATGVLVGSALMIRGFELRVPRSLLDIGHTLLQ